MGAAQSLRQLFDNMDANLRKEHLSKGSVFNVSLDLIEEDPGFNTRDYDTERVVEKIREYADAFKRGDVFPPLQVKVVDGKILLRDGYLRTRGARLAREEGAQIMRLPCIEVAGDEAVQDLVILKSNDGLKLLPLERSAVYVRMMQSRGLSIEEIASIDGRTPANIMQYINAYNLPLALKKFINQNIVSMSYANDLFNEHGTKAIELINDHINSVQNSEVQQNADGGSKKPKPPRITAKSMAARSGYRARFTPQLVKDVTDNIRQLTSTLKSAKVEGDSCTLVLPRDQYESILKLASEIEPKSKKEKPGVEESNPSI